MIFDILKESYKIVKDKRAVAKLKAERKHVAKVFNDMYTYRHVWLDMGGYIDKGSAMYGLFPKKGHAWMCPDCNKIHIAEECSAFSGLQFPHCCNVRSGHRLYENIRTK